MMRKFISILLLIALASCTTLEKATFFPSEENLYGVDFKKYTEKGFLITPEKYTGDYASIGVLTYELIPSSQYAKTGRTLNRNYDPQSSTSGPQFYDIYQWVDDKINVQQALDSLYNICVKRDADALMNFTWETITRPHTGIENPHTVVGVKLSGFAIKRD